VIGVDTSVLVRLVVEDDPKQANLVEQFFAALTTESPGFVSLATLIETVWTLRRTYKFDQPSISRFVYGLLGSRELVVQAPDVVRRATQDSMESKTDFSDAIIAHLGIDADCDYTVTFDKRAAALPGMRLLA
jgi:predicted nucleic-acid-binding protein